MTQTRLANLNLDLLLTRYAQWRADYTGELMDVALPGVRACVEEALLGSEVLTGFDANRWAVAISLSPCSRWTARSRTATWDPLTQDLTAFMDEHPSAELVLAPDPVLSMTRLAEFLL